jgi:hypothetical protein
MKTKEPTLLTCLSCCKERKALGPRVLSNELCGTVADLIDTSLLIVNVNLTLSRDVETDSLLNFKYEF